MQSGRKVKDLKNNARSPIGNEKSLGKTQPDPQLINWNESRIISPERDPDKKTFIEDIDTERSIYNNMPLNTYANIDHWKTIVRKIFNRQS